MHLLRASLLRGGMRLTEAVAHLARGFGIRVSVIPMSDDPVRTRISTDSGELSMQEWFVRAAVRSQPCAACASPGSNPPVRRRKPSPP